ncbi:hypothetical protein BC938DRAFT_477586 [Jimgerdemannia flammicorona]|uniref:Uncharacterized protein n=1 Tax=Jimgerdemannia flammicorona TaxID=994334 RepID=A0A433P925_9FUNG|nr:hypothetical protein BC938DRAFT_477586 [Jimgerdemannia flammicorona]
MAVATRSMTARTRSQTCGQPWIASYDVISKKRVRQRRVTLFQTANTVADIAMTVIAIPTTMSTIHLLPSPPSIRTTDTTTICAATPAVTTICAATPAVTTICAANTAATTICTATTVDTSICAATSAVTTICAATPVVTTICAANTAATTICTTPAVTTICTDTTAATTTTSADTTATTKKEQRQKQLLTRLHNIHDRLSIDPTINNTIVNDHNVGIIRTNLYNIRLAAYVAQYHPYDINTLSPRRKGCLSFEAERTFRDTQLKSTDKPMEIYNFDSKYRSARETYLRFVRRFGFGVVLISKTTVGSFVDISQTLLDANIPNTTVVSQYYKKYTSAHCRTVIIGELVKIINDPTNVEAEFVMMFGI